MAAVAGVAERSSRDGRSDGGAVAVEALLVSSVLSILVFGMIDLTLLVRDHLAVTTLAREGARTASAEPRLPGFAADAVSAIGRSAVTLPLDDRVSIWVYKSATADGKPPAACGTSTCEVYTLDPNTGKFTRTAGDWGPQSINACLAEARDYVGVRVATTHDWLIGLAFPGAGPGVSSRTVMQFEPVIPNDDAENYQQKCKGIV